MKMKYPGMKLRDTPIEYRLLMRLVMLRCQGKSAADLEALAKEEGVEFAVAMQAVNKLIAEKQATVQTNCATGGPAGSASAWHFTFTVDGKTIDAVQSDAAAYRRHLLAKAHKAMPRRANPNLTPITDEERQRWLAKARPLASTMVRLEKAHIAHQLAGCIARIGLKEVEVIIGAVTDAELNEGSSAMASFFDLYCARRDELFAPE